MIRKATALLLPLAMLLAMAPRALACSCAWSGPFLRVTAGTSLVIRGVVRGYGSNRQGFPQAMEVEVLEVFKGRAPARRIIVWGDNGAQCRPYVTAFPIGTEWVFALHGGGNPLAWAEYVISICGEYWLKVEGANAVGQVTGDVPTAKPQTVPLEQLRKILGKPSSRGQTTTRTWSSPFFSICGTTASGAG